MRYVPIDRANILAIVFPQRDHRARIAEIGQEAWAEEVLDLFVAVATAKGATQQDALRAIAIMAALVRNVQRHGAQMPARQETRSRRLPVLRRLFALLMRGR